MLAGQRCRRTEEADAVRMESHLIYAADQWIVAHFDGLTREKALFRAGEFGQSVTLTRLTEVFDAVSTAADVFDVAVFVMTGGVGAVIAGIHHAAGWLARRASRLARSAATEAAELGGRSALGSAARAARPDAEMHWL